MSEIFSKILKDKNGKVLNVGSQYRQPEWGSEVAMVDVLPEATYEWVNEEESFALIKNDFKLTFGKKYTVEYNGTTYSCTARYEPAPSEAPKEFLSVCLGRLYDLDDTVIGEEFPFSIYAYSEQMAEMQNAYGEIGVFDGANPFTISIQAVEETIHKIPGEYVGGVGKYKQPEWGIEENGVILPEATYEINPDSGAAMVVTPINASIVDGCVYTVNYGGVDYACIAVESADAGGYVLGNGSMLGIETPNVDSPFMLVVTFEEAAQAEGIYAMLFPLDGAESCTFSIKGELTHKIPAEYVSSGKLYVVKVSGSAPHTFDKPFDEIYKALSAGRAVSATDGSEYFPVAGWSENKITFVLIYHINSDLVYRSYEYNSDGTTTYAFGTIGNSNT